MLGRMIVYLSPKKYLSFLEDFGINDVLEFVKGVFRGFSMFWIYKPLRNPYKLIAPGRQ